ncbi:MAG: glycerate kinase [Terriglobia bacterium]
MKIVVAPDKFKGTLSAIDAAEAIRTGLSRVLPHADVDIMPLADGGEGTVSALVAATGGSLNTKQVTGPTGNPVQATYGFLGPHTPDVPSFRGARGSTAVVELAQASGLHHLPLPRRNPLLTTTFGTGELIQQASADGARTIIVGLGGSATHDCGMGLGQALGVEFRDGEGRAVGRGGRCLSDLVSLSLSAIDAAVLRADIVGAYDVGNELTGPAGAAAVYGRQKGASDAQIEQLEKGALNFAAVVERILHKDVAHFPGAGAAGGVGAGLRAFFDAEFVPGANLVLDLAGAADRIRDADLVITGEGRVDRQTAFGKAPAAVASLAREFGLPVYAMAGEKEAGDDWWDEAGFDGVFSLTEYAGSRDESRRRTAHYLARVAAEFADDLSTGGAARSDS